jgi:myosin heavy subunit
MDQTSIDGVPDLTQLGELHQGSIFHNLQLRFMRDEIYTYCGNILVALNPFKQLAGDFYSEEQVARYRGQKLGSLPPHIYAIANYTYESLITSKQNQCVVIR